MARHPNWTPINGDPAVDLSRTLGDVLGTGHEAKLSPAAKNLTWKDLLRMTGWFEPSPGWKPGNPPPPAPPQIQQLTLEDLHSIAEAFESKTGLRYAEGYMLVCCTCT